MAEATADKTCTKCGVTKPPTEFYMQRGKRQARCGACVREYAKAWRVATIEVRREQNRAYYRANKERFRAYQVANRERLNARARERLANDPELRARQNASVARWIAAHPERMAEHYHAKRARRRRVVVGVVDFTALWTGLCGICGDSIDPALRFPDSMSKSIDHIIPLARGGAHTQGNCQWAHLGCNNSKGARAD